MSRHITIGFDGTQQSTEALRWAAAEASVRGCGLRIVSCYLVHGADDVVVDRPMEAYRTEKETARGELQRARDATQADHPALVISTELSDGSPRDVLVEHPADEQDLVVVGPSGHHGASAFWLGTTARAVIHHAKCPVAVVLGVSNRVQPARVVVGVDGSDASRTALRCAADEADLHKVPLVVVHAMGHATRPNVPRARHDDRSRVDALAVLRDAVALARKFCGAVVAGELLDDVAGPALLGAVDDGDILVLGSRGRGALTARVFGSTVNTVLDQATVPVIVARSGDS